MKSKNEYIENTYVNKKDKTTKTFSLKKDFEYDGR